MSLSSFDLNLLLVLNTVLTEKSVARAAQKLHVTPSAVSNSLARLRSVLGDPLLARKGRGIVATPRALELAPALDAALRALEGVVEGGTFHPQTCTRTFTLAVADAGQIVRIPHLAGALAKQMPRAKLRVVGIDSLVSLGGLSGTEIDVVIGVGTDKAADVHLERLFDERTVLVARRGHPVIRGRLTRKVFDGLKHVAVRMAAGTSLPDLTGQAYARAGISRDVRVIVPTFTAAAAIVAQTDFVATLPASLQDVLGPRFDLKEVDAPVASPVVTMFLGWHERTHSDPSMVAFRELVRQSIRATVAPTRK